MALKTWGELEKSDAYKNLTPEKRESARIGYFEQNVAPNVSPEKLPGLRKQWDSQTGLARPATPLPGVAKPNSNVTTPQAMARPTTVAQAAPQQTAIPRPGAPAAPKGKAGFIEGVKDYGRGVVTGITKTMPEAVANLGDYFDTPEFDEQGNKLNDDGQVSRYAREMKEAGEHRAESWQQSEYGKQMAEQESLSLSGKSVQGAAYQAGEMTPLSFGLTLVGAALGGAIARGPGARLGAKIGSWAALPLFFGLEAKDSYDQAYEAQKELNPDMTDEEAHDQAMVAGAKTGGIEAIGEKIADYFTLGFFKGIPSGVKNDLVKASTKGIQGVVPMIKGMAKVVGAEVGTELAQGAGQAEVMETYGVGEGTKWNELKKVIMPTILMSLVGGGVAGGIGAHQRYKTATALQNPKLPPEERIKAAQQVAGALAQEDVELGDMFYGYAVAEIAAGNPVIAQGDQFYRDLKPMEQRKIDKERTEAGESPSTSRESTMQRPGSKATPKRDSAPTPKRDDVIATDSDQEFQEVEGDESVITPPAPKGEEFQDVEGDGSVITPPAPPTEPGQPLTLDERKVEMTRLNAELKILQAEMKVAIQTKNVELANELKGEIQSISSNTRLVSAGERPVPSPRQEKEAAAATWDEGSLTPDATEADTRPVLQNRDRTKPASIKQMTDIAANPDYKKVSISRDFANGAPMVEPGIDLAPENLGREDVAAAADGREIPFQYAVVEAEELLPSNSADGTPNAEYADGIEGMSRSIAGNGRTAGLQLAYEQGTADDYREALEADAEAHGVDQGAIEEMENPILVRIMPMDQITDDIGDVSNTRTTAELTPGEQAVTDTQRININEVELLPNGEPSLKAVEQFIASMPSTESAGLLDGKKPNRRAFERLANAIFAQAYESDELLRLAAESTDPEVRNIMAALQIAAGKMSRLKGAGDYDIRPLVVEAAETAVNAKREGQVLGEFIKQADMGRNPFVQPILEMMAENIRSSKAMGESLSIFADTFYAESERADVDMFGDVQKRPPQELMDEVYGTGKIEQKSEGDAGKPGGNEDAAPDIERPKTNKSVEGSPGKPAPQRPEVETSPAKRGGAIKPLSVFGPLEDEIDGMEDRDDAPDNFKELMFEGFRESFTMGDISSDEQEQMFDSFDENSEGWMAAAAQYFSGDNVIWPITPMNRNATAANDDPAPAKGIDHGALEELDDRAREAKKDSPELAALATELGIEGSPPKRTVRGFTQAIVDIFENISDEAHALITNPKTPVDQQRDILARAISELGEQEQLDHHISIVDLGRINTTDDVQADPKAMADRIVSLFDSSPAKPSKIDTDQPKPADADFDEMVVEAQKWRGAAMNADAMYGDNNKARLKHSKMTTKGDLDAYLQEKFGIDEVTARNVSNELTQKNLPDDKSATVESYAGQPWADAALAEDPLHTSEIEPKPLRPDDFALTQETEAEREARDKEEAETVAADKKANQEAEAKARKEKDAADTKDAVDSSVDRFELGQDTEQQLSGQGGMFDDPAPAPAPKKKTKGVSKGLDRIRLSREVEVEETGEIVTLEESADKVWSRHTKRGKVLKSLLECVT